MEKSAPVVLPAAYYISAFLLHHGYQTGPATATIQRSIADTSLQDKQTHRLGEMLSWQIVLHRTSQGAKGLP